MGAELSSCCEDAAAVRRRVGEDRRWEARGGIRKRSEGAAAMVMGDGGEAHDQKDGV